MKSNKFVSTYTAEIEAAAFRTIAQFVHETYDQFEGKDITGDEGKLVGIVMATESLLDSLNKEEDADA